VPPQTIPPGGFISGSRAGFLVFIQRDDTRAASDTEKNVWVGMDDANPTKVGAV
jgi:hypothetical protein